MSEETKKIKKNNIEVDDQTKASLLKVQMVGLKNGFEMKNTSEKVKLALAVFESAYNKLSPEHFKKLTGLDK